MRCLPLVLLAACAVGEPPSLRDTGDPWLSAPPAIDLDGDGWSAPEDCDDADPWRHPGAPEVCDGIDNDCAGGVDDAMVVRTFVPDLDGDGYGDPNPNGRISARCAPVGYSPHATDCHDADATVHPLITRAHQALHAPLRHVSPETSEADRDPAYVADGIDQDCDDVDLCWADLDGDGFGDPLRLTPDDDRDCANASQPTAHQAGDCDDADPGAHPGGEEIPGDALDQDCDGTDLCFQDLDGDGFGTDTLVTIDGMDCDAPDQSSASRPGDCDDDPVHGPEVFPGQADRCDGIDNNCDGILDLLVTGEGKTWFLDADGDGVGDASQSIRACGTPEGYAPVAGDCDDHEPRAYPGNVELCDGIDNNCEAGVDEDSAIDVKTWYLDEDGDGCGGRTTFVQRCSLPTLPGSWIPAGRRHDDDDTDPSICTIGCTCSSGDTRPGASLLLFTPLLALRRRQRWASK